MSRITLVRHGETEWNRIGRFQGSADIPLNDTGRAQAAAVAERLKDVPFTHVVCSDLSRAHDTGQAINAYHQLPVRLDPRLREFNFGQLEGGTYQAFEAKMPSGWLHMSEHPDHVFPPDGDSLNGFAARVESAWHELMAVGEQQHVLVATHGLTLRVLTCLVLGLPIIDYWKFRFGNTGVTEIVLRARGAVIDRLNDTAHLS